MNIFLENCNVEADGGAICSPITGNQILQEIISGNEFGVLNVCLIQKPEYQEPSVPKSRHSQAHGLLFLERCTDSLIT
jgi:hypothetical protein